MKMERHVSRLSFLRRTVLALACALTVPAVATAGEPDPRQYMHGIGAVPGTTANTFNVFFSASGLPPRGADRNGSWPHDVYVAQWHADTGVLDAPRIFIQKPEAQEPVTVARNRAGQVMVSFEDGWNAPENVNQRFGIYDTALRPIKPYPQLVESGGHSGHITAVGDRFVVFYSDGWITGGGVDNLGSGNGVYLKVYDGRGRRLHNVDVADGRREWWPMVAGGSTNALLAWQQFVPGQTEANLKIAVFDPVSGRVTGEQLLHKHLQYYTYSVTWMPAIERYLLVGVAKGNGFADLIDTTGKVRASISCMPATVREAGITVNQNTAYTPAADGRLLQLQAGPDSLTLSATLLNTDGKRVQWRPVGSTGLLRTSGAIDWMSLTEKGLEQLHFDPTKTQPANAVDQCR
ncbi:hypothetical protein [Ralstonia holmesii]|uniref:Uncharacterized protein n=1 Tax=Ralstonia holmesii TaxID=3058602 RepID=A0ABC8QJW9_9RALS|nr:hypothetical protein [Ralstonia sp. LMG 32967]CAJ0806876.1 hypothetical protein LMG18096_04869 [Ralstonia sp. LMG 32967]CAJ0821457.1 hypothetical protein LMG18093_04707 [Ralstonia sp. LMG 32967]